MDVPILYTRIKVALPDSPEQLTLSRSLYIAIANDDKVSFMKLISDPKFQEHRHSTANQIFEDDALDIATAVFNGETEGLIDFEDVFNGGMTPLHLAASYHAPRLTEFLIGRGDEVDAVCHRQGRKVTPFDLSTEIIFTGEGVTVFDLLWRICYHNRNAMEVIRILVRSEPIPGRFSKLNAFYQYAQKGELHKLAALYLAVPELFYSGAVKRLFSAGELLWKGNDWENKSFVEMQLPILLQFLRFGGGRLAGYIRDDRYPVKVKDDIWKSKNEINYFIREFALKTKTRPADQRDCYFSYFDIGFEVDKHAPPTDKPDWIDDDEYVEHPSWEICFKEFEGNNQFYLLPYFLARKDFDRDLIYRSICFPSGDESEELKKVKGIRSVR